MRIETRKSNTEAWFVHGYAGSLVIAMTDFNRLWAHGYHVRIVNHQIGFVVQES